MLKLSKGHFDIGKLNKIKIGKVDKQKLNMEYGKLEMI